jgi:hypothetical protein
LGERLQIINPIKFFTPLEIQNIIQEDLNPRIAPGYDVIAGRTLKETPRKYNDHLLDLKY